MFDVACPCCEAILKIDPETRAVIAHTVPVKPPLIEDLAAEVAKLKGAGDRREQLFQKQFEAEKSHGKVLEKKFHTRYRPVAARRAIAPSGSRLLRSYGQISRFSAKPHSSSTHCCCRRNPAASAMVSTCSR